MTAARPGARTAPHRLLRSAGRRASQSATMRRMRAALAGLLVAASSAAALAQAEALDDARFAALQRQLTPDPSETWRTIPWRINLLDAQAEAAAAQKPLFVWAMDGHPLGCT